MRNPIPFERLRQLCATRMAVERLAAVVRVRSLPCFWRNRRFFGGGEPKGRPCPYILKPVSHWILEPVKP